MYTPRRVYSDPGSDIVCHSLTTVALTTILFPLQSVLSTAPTLATMDHSPILIPNRRRLSNRRSLSNPHREESRFWLIISPFFDSLSGRLWSVPY
ncbi:hypothetical protein Bca4012_062383 [Brassica carinata]